MYVVFFLYIFMIKQRKAKKIKTKKNQKTNMELASNLLHVHVTKNPTEYAPLSHLIKLTENKNRNTIIFRLFLLKFLLFFFKYVNFLRENNCWSDKGEKTDLKIGILNIIAS